MPLPMRGVRYASGDGGSFLPLRSLTRAQCACKRDYLQFVTVVRQSQRNSNCLLQSGGQTSEQIGSSGIDGGAVDAQWTDSACSDNVTAGRYSRYQRSGLEPASERSSLEEKTANSGEFKANGH